MVNQLGRDFQDHASDKTAGNAIAITWHVSFDRIPKEERNTAELLLFCSCLENRAVPLSILPSMGSKEDLIHAIGTLSGYSFIAKQAGDKFFDVHALVHRGVQIRMQNQDVIDKQKIKAIIHLLKKFPLYEWEQRDL